MRSTILATLGIMLAGCGGDATDPDVPEPVLTLQEQIGSLQYRPLLVMRGTRLSSDGELVPWSAPVIPDPLTPGGDLYIRSIARDQGLSDEETDLLLDLVREERVENGPRGYASVSPMIARRAFDDPQDEQ